MELKRFLERQSAKWETVPSSRLGRSPSSELLALSDKDLLEAWREHDQETSSFSVRGWYRERYREQVKGKEIVDLGCGFSVDGIYFLEAGASVTFADIVPTNLRLVERVAAIRGVRSNCRFVHLENPLAPILPGPVDMIFAIGSLHHIPFAWARREISALARFFRPGGKFCLFTYPWERFFESSALDFSEFGKKTDGAETPWAEWYDNLKILHLFDGLDFSLTYEKNFGKDEKEFIWHELTQRT
jgi:SAM-dependent methyltransferase